VRSPRRWTEPQAGSTKTSHQLTTRRRRGTGGDHVGVVLLGDVVVVTLERSPRDPHPLGEVVQLGERRIADQVRPLPAAEPPHRFVDEHGHPTTLPRTMGSDRVYGGTMSPDEVLVQTWRRIAGPGAVAIEAMLVTRHAEPHRRYHTADHVRWVLHHVEAILAAEPRPDGAPVDDDAIRVAALFHDIVYDPRSTTNETESADIAVVAVRAAHWDPARQGLVHDLIEATASHSAGSFEAAVLLDADLAVLGAGAASYLEYVAAVRSEYGFVDDTAWRAGRAAVLRSFLDRSRIFATETMHADREAQARSNIATELAQLGEH